MARMTAGDELKLSLDPVGQRAHGRPWEGLGQVLRISDSEVALMMLGGNVPTEITDGYQVTSSTERHLLGVPVSSQSLRLPRLLWHGSSCFFAI